MAKPEKDELFRLAVQGTFQEFVDAAVAYFDTPTVTNYSLKEFEKLHAKWRDWPANPYRQKEVPKPVMKMFRVTFARIGSHPDFRGFTTFVKAPELAATVAPIKELVDSIFEDEYDVLQANIPVTLVDDKGQLNYGLLGEFTVVEMPS